MTTRSLNPLFVLLSALKAKEAMALHLKQISKEIGKANTDFVEALVKQSTALKLYKDDPILVECFRFTNSLFNLDEKTRDRCITEAARLMKMLESFYPTEADKQEEKKKAPREEKCDCLACTLERMAQKFVL